MLIVDADIKYEVIYTSLVRTSLHSVPKSFILAKASSRRLPCSTPLQNTNGGEDDDDNNDDDNDDDDSEGL